MNALFRPAIAMVGLSTLLLGLAAPLAMTGLAEVIFPRVAGGSLIERDGHVIGSALIGQNFAGEGYFHPRPSATTTPYDASSSAASQRGPTSAALLKDIGERAAALGGAGVPADAVTASASGLDPDISPENAARQVPRIARARGVDEARVISLLSAQVEGLEWGLFGERRVNVLRLNLALDAMH